MTKSDTRPTPEPAPQSAPASPARRLVRRLAVATLAVAALAGAGRFGWQWWDEGRFLEETDDAFLAADMVAISPKIAGYVATLAVADNQEVKAGDVLLRIDDHDLQVGVRQAAADVAQAEAALRDVDVKLSLQQASIAQAGADVAGADAALNFSQQDQNRYRDLVKGGFGTVQRAQQADSDLRQKQAQVARNRAAQTGARKQVDALDVERQKDEAALAKAQAQLDQARLTLSYATVVAPVSGAVGDRTVRLGQYVQPGALLMSIVPLRQDVYVTANFKETQIERMAPGETVRLKIDAFPGRTLRGRVDSLAPGSGAQFALLPPENATGNFTKIVQRVPVKIRFDGQDPGLDRRTLDRLRPGLSVQASVDTRTEPPAKQEPAAVAETR